MAFMVSNEDVVDFADKPKTIDGLNKEIDDLWKKKHKLMAEIEEKIKLLDKICGANADDLWKFRTMVIDSTSDGIRDDVYEVAEDQVALYSIFDLLELYGEENETADKIEADIAATKMLRGEL